MQRARVGGQKDSVQYFSVAHEPRSGCHNPLWKFHINCSNLISISANLRFLFWGTRWFVVLQNTIISWFFLLPFPGLDPVGIHHSHLLLQKVLFEESSMLWRSQRCPLLFLWQPETCWPWPKISFYSFTSGGIVIFRNPAGDIWPNLKTRFTFQYYSYSTLQET